MRRNLAPGCMSSDVNLCQRKPLFPFFSGTPFSLFSFFFCFFLALQRLARLKCNLEPNCGAYLGVSILQPHASTQRFRLRILRRTRSNAGRGASQVEYKPFGKPPLKREPWALQGAAYGLARGTGWVQREQGRGVQNVRSANNIIDALSLSTSTSVAILA